MIHNLPLGLLVCYCLLLSRLLLSILYQMRQLLTIVNIYKFYYCLIDCFRHDCNAVDIYIYIYKFIYIL
nr:MAG TPA: hypothetical protein [Caudoviricetes sp.]